MLLSVVMDLEMQNPHTMALSSILITLVGTALFHTFKMLVFPELYCKGFSACIVMLTNQKQKQKIVSLKSKEQ